MSDDGKSMHRGMVFWLAWTGGWMMTELGHGSPATQQAIMGLSFWVLVSVVVLALRIQEGFLEDRHRKQLEELKKGRDQ